MTSIYNDNKVHYDFRSRAVFALPKKKKNDVVFYTHFEEVRDCLVMISRLVLILGIISQSLDLISQSLGLISQSLDLGLTISLTISLNISLSLSLKVGLSITQTITQTISQQHFFLVQVLQKINPFGPYQIFCCIVILYASIEWTGE